MSYSDLPSSAQNSILHHLTKLIVMDAHRRVLHDGVKETLTEIRSAYWLIRGRQFVRKLIYRCVICRKIEGKPYQNVAPPPLPEYRVKRFVIPESILLDHSTLSDLLHQRKRKFGYACTLVV